MTAPFAANALLGLLAALLWGGGDFGGGVAVKRGGGTLRAGLFVLLTGHAASLLVVGLIAYGKGDAFPQGAPLWWGVCGGAIAALSLLAFYLALSTGHMGVSAALSGLLCASIPAVVSAFTEGRPGWMRLAGFAMAATAIWLIAAPTEKEKTDKRVLLYACVAGVGFGVYFVMLKYAGVAGVLWPMGTARIGSCVTAIVLLPLLSLRMGLKGVLPELKSFLPRRAVLPWILGGAALDTCGNLAFVASTRAGRLDVAAVLASLYPASTIVLAAWLLHERMGRRQVGGMLLALPAVVLITL